MYQGRIQPFRLSSSSLLFSSDIWRKKIITQKQPSGGSLKIFVKFFIDTCEEHCRLLAYNLKY